MDSSFELEGALAVRTVGAYLGRVTCPALLVGMAVVAEKFQIVVRDAFAIAFVIDFEAVGLAQLSPAVIPDWG
jgi:hypothetical protein